MNGMQSLEATGHAISGGVWAVHRGNSEMDRHAKCFMYSGMATKDLLLSLSSKKMSCNKSGVGTLTQPTRQ